MDATTHFDVFIIGAGQAGPTLATSLAQAGKRVAIAERKHAGGSCINFGCTPTKAAIACARVAHLARRGAEFGVRVPTAEVDYGAVLARARRIAEASRSKLNARLAKTDQLRLIPGHVRIEGRDADGFRVRANGQRWSAAQLVLDTGTRSVIPPIDGLDRVNYIHASNWLDAERLPSHIAVIGGGYIGLEMAQFYRRMGSRVTIVESGTRIAAGEDADVALAMQQLLEDEGIAFRLAARVDSVAGSRGRLELRLVGTSGSEVLPVSDVFVATGRQPNTDDLGLETIGVAMAEHGVVKVDERLSTSVPGVWAAGDIRGGAMFTHTAWDDYRIIESQIIGDGSRTTQRIVPYAVFTDPELGRAGMTETQARQAGHHVRIGRFEMEHSGKASEIGETKGFIKLVIDADKDRILGAAVLASEGAELVHTYVVLMNADVPLAVLRNAVFIHPTLSEAVQSAAAETADS